jgi:hypothetical protein
MQPFGTPTFPRRLTDWRDDSFACPGACPMRSFFRGLCLLALFAVTVVARSQEPALSAPAEPAATSLHEQIDALIERDAVGPLNPLASDADFLRRIHLDLAGVIPTAEEARAFLNDPDPEKRAKRIDALLDSPQFARQMALAFDLVLIERRADKSVKETDWEEYLRKSFADNKPLDQLFRELLVTDGSDEATRPAAKFLLNRTCEPNAVTRDLGRVYFGMDLQCAQCHDHPLIGDYLQADYYGLYAFVMRTSVFTDKKKKLDLVAEKADGDPTYKSVFTGDGADQVKPRLPKGLYVSIEPAFAKSDEYATAPGKDVRGIPKYSRRAKLAEMLTTSLEFRRNLANRLWAQMFGRGLVHPVDYHHPDNPPSHPELLTLLADELAARNYDAKSLLRELALTRAYQRACDAPRVAELSMPSGTELAGQLESQRADLTTRIAASQDNVAKIEAERKAVQAEAEALRESLAKLEAAVKAAADGSAKATAAQEAAAANLAKSQEAATLVKNAALRTSVATKKLPEDEEVKQAFAILDARAAKLAESAAAAEAEVARLKADVEAARAAEESARTALAAEQAKVPADRLAEIEGRLLAARHERADARYAVARLDRQKSIAELMAQWQEKQADPAAAEPIERELVDRWTTSLQIARLRPLTGEQFARSVLQAGGTMARLEQAAREAVEKDKSPPAELAEASEADRPLVIARLAEPRQFAQLRGDFTTIVNLYGTLPGDDFQATVNQSLFLGNGSQVDKWLGAGPRTLVERLSAIDDAQLLAEDLYLSVLTRLPADEEAADVAAYLESRTEDRSAALGELVWALVSSTEFRFNH